MTKSKTTKALSNSLRIGFGFDTHALEAGLPLWIGGVNIPFHKGAKGHSDADVLLHAICDALFGAAALGDIGTHFSDKDPQFKGIDSALLLKKSFLKIQEAGYSVQNLDTTIILEEPILRPYIPEMRIKIAAILEVDTSAVSVKAKTSENLGFIGRREGISAHAVVLLTTNSDI